MFKSLKNKFKKRQRKDCWTVTQTPEPDSSKLGQGRRGGVIKEHLSIEYLQNHLPFHKTFQDKQSRNF